jgi:hypothetical protein
VAATAVNSLIGYLAATFLDISKPFSPLDGYGTIVPFTVIGVAVATVVYALVMLILPDRGHGLNCAFTSPFGPRLWEPSP